MSETLEEFGVRITREVMDEILAEERLSAFARERGVDFAIEIEAGVFCVVRVDGIALMPVPIGTTEAEAQAHIERVTARGY
jgi:hypothetical protein